jgi:hypothetical protein
VLWSSQVLSLRRTLSQDRKYGSVLVRTLVNQFPPLSFVAAGALTLVDPRYLPLVSVAVLACFVSSVHGAWVLLVEILR